MKKILYKDIVNILEKNNIHPISSLDKNQFFTSIESINSMNESQISFFHNSKYIDYLRTTKAKACFIDETHSKLLNDSCIPIIVKNAYLAYAITSHLFSPDYLSNGKINSLAHIFKNTYLGKNIQINRNVIINENCDISDDSIIQDNTIIGPNVSIGTNTIIMSNCSISNATIGNNCLIQSGSIIGGKGFGFTSAEKIEIKHTGRVIIKDNVDIGSNTTIDRGSIDSTIINKNVRIDNLVQIAHNVIIGENTIIAAQVGIAGSTKIGNNCLIGGQAGVAGHLIIEDNVKIAAKSGVTKNIIKNSTVAGFPAQDIMKWKKSIIKFNYDNK